jgi:hypothetical protein
MHCHVFCNSGPHPLPMWAPVLPRVLQLRTSPLCRGGLWLCHMSCTSEPLLPAKEGSDTAMYPTAPDPAFLPGWAPALPRASRLSVGRGSQI